MSKLEDAEKAMMDACEKYAEVAADHAYHEETKMWQWMAAGIVQLTSTKKLYEEAKRYNEDEKQGFGISDEDLRGVILFVQGFIEAWFTDDGAFESGDHLDEVERWQQTYLRDTYPLPVCPACKRGTQ